MIQFTHRECSCIMVSHDLLKSARDKKYFLRFAPHTPQLPRSDSEDIRGNVFLENYERETLLRLENLEYRAFTGLAGLLGMKVARGERKKRKMSPFLYVMYPKKNY